MQVGSTNIEGKVVVNTGASSGLGEATARYLAARGAAVVLGARRVDQLQALVDEITAAGGRAFALPTGEQDAVVLVAVRDGLVVGYSYATVEGPDWMALRGPAGVVHDLVVDPAHRCGGVGRQLLETTLSALRERGVPCVVLSTAARNDAAQRLFARMGFRSTMVEMTRDLGAGAS